MSKNITPAAPKTDNAPKDVAKNDPEARSPDLPEGVVGYTDDGHPILESSPQVESKVTRMSKGVVDIMVDMTHNKKPPKNVYRIPSGNGKATRRDN